MSDSIFKIYGRGTYSLLSEKDLDKIKREPLALWSAVFLGLLMIPFIFGSAIISGLICKVTNPNNTEIAFEGGKLKVIWDKKGLEATREKK